MLYVFQQALIYQGKLKWGEEGKHKSFEETWKEIYGIQVSV